ncbi:MAG: LD-carboxypeptidase [Anaerovoracaceae bacterium]
MIKSKPLTRPAHLKKGDTVAITAPSSPVPSDVLKTSIASIKFLGLNPVVMPCCNMSHGYLSGKDDQRSKDLNNAFSNPDIKGIFCLRGGFGATRLLPLLDYDTIKRNPKVFVGYSDITALHLAINKHCGFVTFHGPMPNTGYMRLDPYSLTSLTDNIFAENPISPIVNPPNEPMEIIYPGSAQGILTGGNLSLLLGTLGSPYEVDTRGKILFMEDVGERPYRLDKAFTALALAGKFRDCAGVILGAFTECEEPPAHTVAKNTVIAEGSLTFHDIIDEIIRPFKKPTLNNFRSGHIYPQSTLPMGSMVSFSTDVLKLNIET